MALWQRRASSSPSAIAHRATRSSGNAWYCYSFQMERDSSFVIAGFASFEDFSSRMILLPLHDDECTGAQVGSHEVHGFASHGKMPHEDGCQLPIEAVDSFTSVEMDEAEADHGTADADACCKRQNIGQPQPVPVGYVLVEIRNSDVDEDLETIEFASLLSLLRESSFPLSLVFAAPPNDTHTPTPQGRFFAENNGALCKNGEGDGKEFHQKLSSESSSATLDVEEESSDDDDSSGEDAKEKSQHLATLVSREDAEKYAKQAATAAAQLRGRFSRWGYQAATRAADAASQVKELRDDRQRKSKDEQQSRDDQNGGSQQTNQLNSMNGHEPQDMPVEAIPSAPFDDGSGTGEGKDATHSPKLSDPMEECFLFVQTPAGFEPLPCAKCDDVADSSHEHPSISSSEVVSVRLSKEKACLAKNGRYTFQWYRSKSPMASEDTRDWTLLRGACYAAYQPSVSDAGQYLRCIIKYGSASSGTNISEQVCHLQRPISIAQSLFNSVTTTLLGYKETVTFGNLRDVDTLMSVRVKINVKSNDEFITSSSIFIDKEVSGENKESELISHKHFQAEADPAKPRLFDLICSSHGRLRLDAANRKSRETLLLALGVANFKGKLSSLSLETNLFPSCETEVEISAGSDSSVICTIDEPTPQPNSLAVTSDMSHSERLEARLSEMNSLLLSKDVAIRKLQHEFVSSDKAKKESENELHACMNSEQKANDALAECEALLEVSNKKIDDLLKAQHDAEISHERNLRSLNNEKAVLTSMVEARDHKIRALTEQVASLETSLESEQSAVIESLKSTIHQTQEKCSTSERVIAKMKHTEEELQQDLNSAKGIVLNLNDKFLAVKETATKRDSECRKLKMERNSLKNKADSLSKEMLRMSKDNTETLEIEKLKSVIKDLRHVNGDLQRQIEVEKTEKRDALGKLEAAYMAHRQSVNYQLSTDGNHDACISDPRIAELESVISSMTEYLNAKEMQVDTLKQVNETLTKEVNNLSIVQRQKK
ncbi:hypothetical protein ACHAWF_004415 [Thalassiosira exigua]